MLNAVPATAPCSLLAGSDEETYSGTRSPAASPIATSPTRELAWWLGLQERLEIRAEQLHRAGLL